MRSYRKVESTRQGIIFLHSPQVCTVALLLPVHETAAEADLFCKGIFGSFFGLACNLHMSLVISTSTIGEHLMSGRNNYGGEVAWFLTGVATGLAAGMLFAPRSGEENRRLIREKALEGKDRLKSGVDQGQEYIKRRGAELVDQASEQIDRAKSAVSKQKDQFSGAIQAGVDAYAKTVDAATK